MNQSPPLEESDPALSEVRREIARRFGDPMTRIVSEAVARGQRDAAVLKKAELLCADWTG